MTDEEIIKLITANNKNKYIFKHLEGECSDVVIEMLENLDSSNFKELDKEGSFEFDDIPIPYERLPKKSGAKAEFSSDMAKEMAELLQKINQEGTNIEYPFIMRTEEGSNAYSVLKPFKSGGSQTCEFDWAWIEDYIKNSNKKIKLSLLHTHPNPLGKQHKTLYNENQEKLTRLGVQSDGLNISLADVYAVQYLQMLAEKYGKDIETESTLLMHDGTLISFSSTDGVKLTSEQHIAMQQEQ